MIKVDLHVHTYRSPDSLAMPEDILRWARRRGLDRVAITDHDAIDVALEMHRRWPEVVLVGEEIKTARGEIIGLFLEERIPAGLSPMATVRRIRAQGGVVYVPHPMDRVRGSALAPDALDEIAEGIDDREALVIETLNARVTLVADNRLADAFAARYRLARGAGSDAHHPAEVGTAHVEISSFASADEFRAAIRGARVRGRVSSPLVHLGSTYAKLVKGVMAALPSSR